MENISFLRNKTRLFLGHNSEICLPSIAFFPLECSPLFHSREMSLFYWKQRMMGGMWKNGVLRLYLPCSLSAGLWTGAHCLSGSAGGTVLCSETERKRAHLDTHLFCERASLRKREENDTDAKVLLIRQQARFISSLCKVHSPFFEGNIHLSYCKEKK